MRQLRVGLFLGLRHIQRASLWSTLLIVTIVFFTFLNLVTMRGVLLGIVDNALAEVRSQAYGDINLSPLDGESKIKESEYVEGVLSQNSAIEAFSPRYVGLATIEANYTKRQSLQDDPDVIAVNIFGVDPAAEDATTRMSNFISEGDFLEANDTGYIVLGKYNIDRYSAEYGNVFDSLKDVQIGDKVMVSVGNESREFTVKGIIDSKIELVAIAVFIPEKDFRRIFGRQDRDVDSVIVRLRSSSDETFVRDQLREGKVSKLAQIDGFNDDIPKFIADVRDTFSLLSLIVGITGIAIASITVFIVIFINVLSRRRQIGILKAIGITRRAIEYAYMTQALLYAVVGSVLGIFITQVCILPYFKMHPIDFPYADTTLSITTSEMWILCGLFALVSLISGYFPAALITKQNTLDSILGRK